jgi:hypothetical protein
MNNERNQEERATATATPSLNFQHQPSTISNIRTRIISRSRPPFFKNRKPSPVRKEATNILCVCPTVQPVDRK